MPLVEKIKQYSHKAARWLPGDTGTPKSGRILVLEQIPGNGWKAVEAEIGDDIAVLDARTIPAEDPNGVAALLAASNGTAIALIPDAHKSVCRLLDIANAAPDQIERMVALRLEVELPYPAAESTWVCEPCLNGKNASRALLIAAPTSEIAKAERALGLGDRRSAGIEYAPAGLAELALAAAPSEGTVAVAGMDHGEAVLVLAHAGALVYTRHIRLEPAACSEEGAIEAWVPQFARDVKQSIYDYLLRTGYAAPDCLHIVGKRMGQTALLEAIEAHLETPVRSVVASGLVRVVKPGLSEGDLIAGFPVCLGVLVALRRRRRGERTASPAFRRERRGFRVADWRSRRGALVALNALLCVVFAASVFGVRYVRQNADERLMEQSRPLLGGLQGLQEEVKILEYEDKQARAIVDVMAALAETLPAELQIESVSIDAKGKITLFGKADSVDLVSDKAIPALEASKTFINPKFNGATREKEKYDFQITCELANRGRGSN